VPTRRSHRLWPHTEAIKAAHALAGRGDAQAPTMMHDMAALLDRHLRREPFSGGWTDRIAPDGTPLDDRDPASSLYHLFLAGAVASEPIAPAARPRSRCFLPRSTVWPMRASP
jgi:mannose-6-phosphate isomerase